MPEYVGDQLRTVGKTVVKQERAIGRSQQEINELKGQIAERQRLGKSTEGQEARLARVQAGYEQRVATYQMTRGIVGDQYAEAVRAAPKNYQTGRENAGRPFSQSQVDYQNRQFAIQQARAGTANFQAATGQVQQVTYTTERNYSREPAIISTLRREGPLRNISFTNINKTQSTSTEDVTRRPSYYNYDPDSSSFLVVSGREPGTISPTAQRVTGTKQREENLNKFVDFTRIPKVASYATLGFGKPVEQRSFAGRYSQSLVTQGLSFPITAVPSIINSAEKTYAYFDIKKNKPADVDFNFNISKLSPTNPETLATYTLLAVPVARNQVRSYRTPAQIKFSADSAVVGDVSVARGGVTGTARVLGSAEATYRYGPGKIFSRAERVPFEGSAVYSGVRLPGRGQPYAVNVEGLAQARFGQRTYVSGVDYAGVYGASTGRIALLSRDSSAAFFSQAGRGVSASMITGARTAPSMSAVFRRNPLGVLAVEETSTGRGLIEGSRVQQLQFSRPREGLLADGAGYGELPAGFTGGRARYIAEVEQLVKTRQSGGASYRYVQRGFSDLERQGYVVNPAVQSFRAPLMEEARGLFRSRKGSYQVSSSVSEVLTRIPEQLPQYTPLRTPRAPSFAGLPFGEIRTATLRGPSLLVLPGIGRATNNKINSAVIARTLPSTVTSQSPRTASIMAQTPMIDQVPRVGSLPARDTLSSFDLLRATQQRSAPVAGSTPGSPRVPFPNVPRTGRVLPPVGFPVPPQFDRRKSNARSTYKTTRSFQYVPSLTAGLGGVRGGSRTLGNSPFLTGFEVRPLPATGNVRLRTSVIRKIKKRGGA